MSHAAPEFELFRVEDGNGWKKVSAQQTYADPYIQIERAQYLTPGRSTAPHGPGHRRSPESALDQGHKNPRQRQAPRLATQP